MRRRFFIHMATTIAIGVICSTAYYHFICHGLRETREFFPGRLNSILYDTTRYDAVFMGTSRVCDEIDPLIFDSITHLHSYNAGMEGASFTAVDLFTRRFIANHHPRYVFLNIDIYTMERENSLYDFPQYYPHLQDSDISLLSKRKRELAFGKYAPFIAVSYIDDYLKGIALNDFLGIHSADQTYSHRGFSPVSAGTFYGDSSSVPVSFSFDTANFKKLDDLCRYCRAKDCEVIFIMAPIYRSFDDGMMRSKAFYNSLRKVESIHQIREYNYYTDQRFGKKMFVNKTHLNAYGAMIYSQLIADSFSKRLPD